MTTIKAADDNVYSSRDADVITKKVDVHNDDNSIISIPLWLHHLPIDMSRHQLHTEIVRILAPYRIRIERVVLLHSRSFPIESDDELHRFEVSEILEHFSIYI